MRILVIDDNTDNQAAAKAQLSDHETTVVGSYDEGQKLVERKHEFEVVLVDLVMPVGLRQKSNGGWGLYREMPVGIFLALLAAKNGAMYVGVFSDLDHHQHPASACFDVFNPEGGAFPTPFTVGSAKVVFSNASRWIDKFRPDNFAEPLHWSDEGISVRAKNWRKLFDYLVA